MCSTCGYESEPRLILPTSFDYAWKAKDLGIIDNVPFWWFPPCAACRERKGAEQQKQEAKRLRNGAINRMKAESGLGPKFHDATFDNFLCTRMEMKKAGKGQYGPEDLKRMKQILGTVRHWAENFQNHMETGLSLIFVGDVGTGKNHLSSAAINYIIEKFVHPCRFTSITKIFLEIKDSYSRKTKTELQILRRYLACDLLVLNELGLHPGTDLEFEKINWLVNERIDMNKPFILISNLELEHLKPVIGDRLTDRMASHKILQFSWPSFRGT